MSYGSGCTRVINLMAAEINGANTFASTTVNSTSLGQAFPSRYTSMNSAFSSNDFACAATAYDTTSACPTALQNYK